MPSSGYGFLILPKLSDFLGEFIDKVKEMGLYQKSQNQLLIQLHDMKDQTLTSINLEQVTKEIL